jgi:hypothetical protein
MKLVFECFAPLVVQMEENFACLNKKIESRKK